MTLKAVNKMLALGKKLYELVPEDRMWMYNILVDFNGENTKVLVSLLTSDVDDVTIFKKYKQFLIDRNNKFRVGDIPYSPDMKLIASMREVQLDILMNDCENTVKQYKKLRGIKTRAILLREQYVYRTELMSLLKEHSV